MVAGTERTLGDFRQYLPDLSIPRFTTMKEQDAHEYADAFKTNKQPPWVHALYMHWLKLYSDSFKGVTSDGKVEPGLYQLQDDEIPIDKIVATANTLLGLLSDDQKKKMLYHVDSPEWRTWSNPEFLLSDKGIRLDELSAEVRDAALAVVQSTLSPEGYEKALSTMRINGFLGDLVKSPRVMNEFSYNLVFFGTPSADRPWGWSFYGHHLCLNVFFYKRQLILSPWFTGAEPNLIDEGKYSGTRILYREEELGLRLMQSLSDDLKAKAQVYKEMKDPAMPPGRWNRDDQRHLCGAYRDNRIVPYEGVLASAFDASQKELLYDILEQYLLFLPEKARKLRIEHIRKYESETYFSWIGGYDDSSPFYYRIQSPVILTEFDHHSGVFLTNEQPGKFHVHTLLRTPNGGDYGYALRPLIPPIEGAEGTEIVW
ncbi:hypothetical protein BZA70DRAFT_285795 [Myxozyma melibiosi]|uniref:DUF3500 domain-containing protein n=1 Tax=Myxozyma melibiosi TaxID=54550 RepID=A0ABR1EXW3_9ASCO